MERRIRLFPKKLRVMMMNDPFNVRVEPIYFIIDIWKF